MTTMNTKDAIQLAGSSAALANLLGISRSAVSQWGEKVPPLRRFELRKLRPKWFRVPRPVVDVQAV